MLKSLRKSLCCSYNPSDEINIQIELLNKNHILSDISNQYKYNQSIDTKSPYHYHHQHYNSHIESYYCYIFLDMNNNKIKQNTDFLYVVNEGGFTPTMLNQCDAQYIIHLNLNKFNINTAYAHYNIKDLNLFSVYNIKYFRVEPKNQSLVMLAQTKRFKIVFKDDYNSNKLSACTDDNSDESSLMNKKLTLIYDNHPLFHQKPIDILLQKEKRSHTLLSETAPHSCKTQRYSEDFKTTTHNQIKGSTKDFITNSSIFLESNLPSFISFTNKNSINDNGLLFNQSNQATYISSSRKTNSHDMKKLGHNEVSAFDINKKPLIENSINNVQVDDHESSYNNNQTFIINENKENDGYIKKIWSVLSVNLVNNGDPVPVLNKKCAKNMKNEKDTNINDSGQMKELKLIGVHEDKAIPKDKKKVSRMLDYTEASTLSQNITESPKKKITNELNARLKHNSNNNTCNTQSPELRKTVTQNHLKYSPMKYTIETKSEKCNPTQDKMIDLKRKGICSSTAILKEGSDYNISEKKPIIPIPNIKFPTPFPLNKKSQPTNDTNSRLENKKFSNSLKIPSLEISKSPLTATTTTTTTTTTTIQSLNQVNLEVYNQIPLEPKVEKGHQYETPIMNQLINIHNNNNNNNNMNENSHLDLEERLYTVEEVGSPSKESSTYGELNQLKSICSKSERKQTTINSIRLETEKIISEVEALEFSGSKDFFRESNQSSSKAGGDLPLEVMIIMKKFDDLGYFCEFDHKECSVKLEYKYDYTINFEFKWYNDTSDQDLELYFEEIYNTFKNMKSPLVQEINITE